MYTVCVSVYMYICSVSNKEEGEEAPVTKDKPPLAPKKASTPGEYMICSDRDCVHVYTLKSVLFCTRQPSY